jgi:hypothetical protein
MGKTKIEVWVEPFWEGISHEGKVNVRLVAFDMEVKYDCSDKELETWLMEYYKRSLMTTPPLQNWRTLWSCNFVITRPEEGVLSVLLK